MDVTQAVEVAKRHLLLVFADEHLTDIGLEEVEPDKTGNNWNITIGFSRPWDHKNALTAALGDPHRGRSYKVIHINARGEMVSIKDRILTSPG